MAYSIHQSLGFACAGASNNQKRRFRRANHLQLFFVAFYVKCFTHLSNRLAATAKTATAGCALVRLFDYAISWGDRKRRGIARFITLRLCMPMYDKRERPTPQNGQQHCIYGAVCRNTPKHTAKSGATTHSRERSPCPLVHETVEISM